MWTSGLSQDCTDALIWTQPAVPQKESGNRAPSYPGTEEQRLYVVTGGTMATLVHACFSFYLHSRDLLEISQLFLSTAPPDKSFFYVFHCCLGFEPRASHMHAMCTLSHKAILLARIIGLY